MNKTILFFIALSRLFLASAQSYSLNWVDQLKGNTGAEGGGIKLSIAAGGDLISTGRFQGTMDFDPGPGSYLLSSAGFGVYIIKTTSAGNLIWAKHFENLNISQVPGIGSPAAIREDAAGNIYCVGNFGAIIDFDPGPLTSTLNPGNGRIFISKLNAAGNLVWIKQIAGDSACAVSDLRIDSAGDLILVGNFSGTVNDFDPGPAIQNLSSPGSQDGFVCKINTNGNLIWVKQFNGSGDFSCSALQIDNNSNVYIGGSFTQSCDIDPGPSINTYTTSNGANYFCKLNSLGNYLISMQFGHQVTGDVYGIELDSGGNLILCGSYGNNADFDPSPSVFALPCNGTYSGFVAKYTPTCSLIWAKGLNATIASQCNFLQIDNANNVFVGGPYVGTIDLDPGAGIYQYTTPSVYNDAFILKLDLNGNFILGRQLTGPWGENIISGQLDASANLFLTGLFSNNSDLDPSANVFSSVVQDKDPYILKLSTCLLPSAPTVASPTQAACVSGIFTLSASGSSSISWTSGVPGNIFVSSGTQYITPVLSTTIQNYYAVATNTCGESFPPSQISVTVHAAPVIGLSASNPTFCLWDPVIIAATGGLNYVLQNSFFTSTISIVPLTTAIYTVSGSDVNGCSNSATIQLVRNDCVGLQEQNGIRRNVTAYPNPSNSKVTIAGTSLQSIVLCDLAGRCLLAKECAGNTIAEIDVSQLAIGIYFVSIKSSENTTETIRVVRTN